MAKAFEQKGNTSADKNNSVKTAEGKGLEEEWQGDFVFHMRKEQDEDSDLESEDMFGFVQELEEDGIEMHDRKSLTSRQAAEITQMQVLTLRDFKTKVDQTTRLILRRIIVARGKWKR